MGLLDKFRRKKQPDTPAAPQSDEISPGGSPIYRYQTPEDHDWRPPQVYGAHLEELGKRFAEGQLPLVLDVHRPNLCPDFKEILD